MKIKSSQVSLNQVQQNPSSSVSSSASQKVSKSSQWGPDTSVRLSSEQVNHQTLLNQVRALDAQQENRVDQLKQLIARGAYEMPSSHDLAERIRLDFELEEDVQNLMVQDD